jgi:hypothetical protein
MAGISRACNTSPLEKAMNKLADEAREENKTLHEFIYGRHELSIRYAEDAYGTGGTGFWKDDTR